MHVPDLVADLSIVVVAAALFGYVAQRIGLVSIVGYVLAGIAIGPHALGFIDDVHQVEALGEIGVIFLMFFIGLELGGDLLRKLGKLMFGGGAIQVTVTIALVAGIAAIFGVDWNNGIFTGCLVALSSTAVVLKLLSARDETSTPTGEVSVAVLIFQDIAVVILVLLVPMLRQGGDASLGIIVVSLAKALLLIASVLVVAKWIIPQILDVVWERTDSEEFLLVILAIAGGIAYAVTLLGLTASLGAFVAGLVVSAGEHRERATRVILPFQALFAAFFFASIGMRLKPAILLETWQAVLVFSVLVVLLKAFGVGIAAAVFRRPLPIVVSSGFLLAQIGEFSFILENTGRSVGLSPLEFGEQGSQVFIAVVVLLIALTPVLYRVGTTLALRLQRPIDPPESALRPDTP